jgi:RNA polymerase sigma-70 factor (ECF subfamily)
MARSLNPAANLHGIALDALYRRHWLELCRYVRRTFGAGPPEPEDVAQQAFMSFAAVDDPVDIAHPRAYLFRTAHNIVVDERRRSAGQGATVLELHPAAAEKSDDRTPERVLMGKERLAVLSAAIRALPKERRRSFLFNRLHGLSCAEIARRTGYSDSAVKKHVAQAMDALEAALTAAERVREKRP